MLFLVRDTLGPLLQPATRSGSEENGDPRNDRVDW